MATHFFCHGLQSAGWWVTATCHSRVPQALAGPRRKAACAVWGAVFSGASVQFFGQDSDLPSAPALALKPCTTLRRPHGRAELGGLPQSPRPAATLLGGAFPRWECASQSREEWHALNLSILTIHSAVSLTTP